MRSVERDPIREAESARLVARTWRYIAELWPQEGTMASDLESGICARYLTSGSRHSYACYRDRVRSSTDGSWRVLPPWMSGVGPSCAQCCEDVRALRRLGLAIAQRPGNDIPFDPDAVAAERGQAASIPSPTERTALPERRVVPG